MRIQARSSKSGQAVVMVGVSLIAMSGLMGLAVDLGWSFFIHKMEQSAADAAALAAVNNAMDMLAGGSSYGALATGSGCGGNLSSACTYATNNGFTAGGDSGRQNVMVDGGVGAPAGTPTTVPNGWAPGVNVRYWVTVRITNTVPQLFSAVLGNSTGMVAARSTAALVDGVLNGSVILTGRENDNVPPAGKNLEITGGGRGVAGNNLTAPDGAFLASLTAPDLGGSGAVQGDAIVRGTYSQPSGWSGSFERQNDGPEFLDPMRGKGQPPLPTSPLRPVPVNGTTIDPTSVPAGTCTGGVCQPGIYFATSSIGCPAGVSVCATGARLRVSSNVVSFGNSTWGDYVFYGGLEAGDVQFGPGRYVMAGIGPSTSDGDVFKVTGNITPTSTTDAGRLVILTDANYPGLNTQLSQPGVALYFPQASTMGFGTMDVSKNNTGLILNGLDRRQTLPDDQNAQGNTLSDFAPTVIWQDQRSSTIKYTPNGNIDTSCGSINSPCSNGNPLNGQPGITMKNGDMHLTGLLYQPRGTWMQLEPGNASVISGSLQIITGGITMGGTSGINLGDPVTGSPMLVRIATLVN